MAWLSTTPLPLPLHRHVPLSTTKHSASVHCSSIVYTKSVPLFSNKTRLKFHRQQHRRPLHVVAAQSDIVKALQTAWKVGKDGIKAGTDLVPDSVPRPVARIGVAGVVGFVSLFVLKSFLSTAFFVLATMGLIYFVFIAMNKDEGPRGPGGGGDASAPEDSLEEARRIMEKYK